MRSPKSSASRPRRCSIGRPAEVCTLSWIRSDEGYELHFNRDERRIRQRASAPRVFVSEGVRVLAPRDADAGGSWITVNAFSLVQCLLNGSSEEYPLLPRKDTSRGLLVLETAASRSMEQAQHRIATLSLAIYRPFHLVFFFPEKAPCCIQWDRAALRTRSLDDADRPLVSSACDDTGARRARRELFRQALARAPVDTELLRCSHAGHLPEKGPRSCMHGPNGSTVSYSRVRVDPVSVHFDYQAGPPCEGRPVEQKHIDLVAGAA